MYFSNVIFPTQRSTCCTSKAKKQTCKEAWDDGQFCDWKLGNSVPFLPATENAEELCKGRVCTMADDVSPSLPPSALVLFFFFYFKTKLAYPSNVILTTQVATCCNAKQKCGAAWKDGQFCDLKVGNSVPFLPATENAEELCKGRVCTMADDVSPSLRPLSFCSFFFLFQD